LEEEKEEGTFGKSRFRFSITFETNTNIFCAYSFVTGTSSSLASKIGLVSEMFCRKVNLPKKANQRNVKKNCFCNGKRCQYYFMLQLLFTKNIKVIRHLKLVINVATYSKHFLSLSLFSLFLSLSFCRCIGKNFFPRQLQTKYRWKTINKVLLHYG
jgi:hypothetical protein